MILRFKWCFCCAAALSLQLLLIPDSARLAAAEHVYAAASEASIPDAASTQSNTAMEAGDSGVALLKVTLTAVRESVAVGGIVAYEVTVANISERQAAADAVLMNLIPDGFELKKGSVAINGNSAVDPDVSADGRTLYFAVGNIASGASSVIRFEALAAPECRPESAVSVASAITGDNWVSNIAMATVNVGDEQRQSRSDITVAATPAVPADPVPSEAVAPAAAVVAATTAAFASSAVGDAVELKPAVVAHDVAVAPPVVPVPEQPVSTDIPVSAKSADVAVQPEAKVPPKQSDPEPSDAKPSVIEQVAPQSDSIVQTPHSVLSHEAVTPPPVIEPEPVKKQADNPIVSGSIESEKRNLAGLTGVSELSVLADADGQFVKNMSENQVIKDVVAGVVGETSLIESIRAGRSFNRESLAAMARTEQAKAQTGQAFALLLPSVSVRASSGYETSSPSVALDESNNAKSSDTHLRTDAGLTVRQPLLDLPSFTDWQRRKVIEQARGESYRVSDGDAYVSAVNAYLTLVSSRLQTDMTRQFENQLNELLVYVEKRASAGAASNSDMARVRARSQATMSSRLEQESAHAAAGIEFVRLTNLVPRKVRLPDLEEVGLSLLPKNLDMAVTTAMHSNPELTSLKAEIDAAILEQSAAKGRYYPRVDAEFTDNLSLHAGGDPSSSGQRDQRIMMVLNWNLFSGGSDYKNHVERVARHKELQFRLDDQRRRVVQTLSSNYATLATTRERITSGYQELKSISTAAEAMSKRMLSGNQSLLDLLDVYDRYYQVRSRLVNLHILEMTTVAQLVRITRGTPDVSAASDLDKAVKVP